MVDYLLLVGLVLKTIFWTTIGLQAWYNEVFMIFYMCFDEIYWCISTTRALYLLTDIGKQKWKRINVCQIHRPSVVKKRNDLTYRRQVFNLWQQHSKFTTLQSWEHFGGLSVVESGTLTQLRSLVLMAKSAIQKTNQKAETFLALIYQ